MSNRLNPRLGFGSRPTHHATPIMTDPQYHIWWFSASSSPIRDEFLDHVPYLRGFPGHSEETTAGSLVVWRNPEWMVHREVEAKPSRFRSTKTSQFDLREKMKNGIVFNSCNGIVFGSNEGIVFKTDGIVFKNDGIVFGTHDGIVF